MKHLKQYCRLLAIAINPGPQTSVVGQFLLSVYLPESFQFQASDLEILDDQAKADCADILRLRQAKSDELNEYLDYTHHTLDQLAAEQGLEEQVDGGTFRL